MSGSRWDPFGRTERLRQLRQTQLEQGAQLNRIERKIDSMSQGLDELNAQIATLKASEQALIQREDARDAAEKARADALQAALDDLKAHPAAPDLSGPIAAIAAIQAEMDAAAPPAAGGTPPA